MRRPLLALSLVLSCAALSSIACGGAVSPGVDGDAGSGTDAVATDSVVTVDTPGRVPLLHRLSAPECSRDRAPGSGSSDPGGGGDCKTDADCKAGINGRCESFRGWAQCTYDKCFADAECGTGGVCACRGIKGGAGSGSANVCLNGNCRIDADCGAGGYCSPTYGTSCGAYGGFVGYYCHTAKDTCIDDADCPTSSMGPGYCAYQSTIGHWACAYSWCAG